MGQLLRVLVLIFGLLLMAGFGLCGLLGVAISFEEIYKPGSAQGDFAKVFGMGLTGMAISAAIGLVLWLIMRKKRAPEPPRQ